MPLLRDLFQQERYEDIVEAIELHVGALENSKGGRRKYLHKKIEPIINSAMMGKELSGYRIAEWERFFKDDMEGKTWQEFILVCLQNRRIGAFSSGIKAIKQSIQDFKSTR